MTTKEFQKIIKDKSEEEMTAPFFLSILIEHFLGKNWYSQCWDTECINKDAVMDILRIYPRPSMKRAYDKVFGERLGADRNE